MSLSAIPSNTPGESVVTPRLLLPTCEETCPKPISLQEIDRIRLPHGRWIRVSHSNTVADALATQFVAIHPSRRSLTKPPPNQTFPKHTRVDVSRDLGKKKKKEAVFPSRSASRSTKDPTNQRTVRSSATLASEPTRTCVDVGISFSRCYHGPARHAVGYRIYALTEQDSQVLRICWDLQPAWALGRGSYMVQSQSCDQDRNVPPNHLTIHIQ